MKYDGSAGVRAAYSSTRLRYVRCVAMILVGSTGGEVLRLRRRDPHARVEHDIVALEPAPGRRPVVLHTHPAIRHGRGQYRRHPHERRHRRPPRAAASSA